MCGKLAVYLRVCGHDVAYALDRDVEADDRLLELAAAEDRIVVTRDEQLASRATGAHLLTERDVEDQLCELAEQGVDLTVPDQPERCGTCNGVLVAEAELTETETSEPNRPDHVPDDIPAFRCRDCGQWFWKGSHWERMVATLEGASSNEN